jgi:hypothetical protein
MNAAEHIVEAYFRFCRNCFTFVDRKVLKGNGRQLDILAYDLINNQQFHIEVSVTHQLEWCLHKEQMLESFEKKFVGTPPKREGKSNGTTDFEKGKSYFEQIQQTYQEVGFDPNKVQRVWVCWIVKNETNSVPMFVAFKSPYLERELQVEVLSLLDFVLPALEKAIETSNYDDEVLRTLSFIKQRDTQIKGA